MKSNFRKIRAKVTPRWQVEGEGGLVGLALDLMKDAFAERARLGLLARFPQNDPTGNTTAPEDALLAMGRDRGVVQGRVESLQDYAFRLTQWLVDAQTAGAPFTLLKKLAEYCGPGFAFRTVDARGNWFSRDADGVETAVIKQANWNWDGPVAERWSRFWVILYPNGIFTAGDHDWGDSGPADWGDPVATWGSTATLEEVTAIRNLVADWMPDGTRCVAIIEALDPASFDPASPEPDGLWGHWSKNVGGVQVPARLSTARYWDGV